VSRDASTFATVHVAVSQITGEAATSAEDETSEYAQYAYFKGMNDALSVSYLKFFEVFRRSQREVRQTFSAVTDVMKFTINQRRIGEFFASYQRSLQSEEEIVDDAKERPAVLIILDNSSSMLEKTSDGRTKFDVAKTCLKEIVRSCSQSQTWGIIDFRGCTPVLVQRFTKSREEVLRTVEAINAYGTTPIAGGLELSLVEMENDPMVKRCIVVLLTDGMETCGGDPLRSAASFGMRSPLFLRTVGSISLMPMAYAQERLKPAFLYVIGFGVDTTTDVYLRAIAAAAAGRYFAANDLAQLLDALKEALKIVLTPEWETPVLVFVLMVLLGGIVWAVLVIKKKQARSAA
jgi:Mg-chelatase subunit ChlD